MDDCVINVFILYRKIIDATNINLSVARGWIGILEPRKQSTSSASKQTNYFKKVIPPEVRYDKCAHMSTKCRSTYVCTLQHYNGY